MHFQDGLLGDQNAIANRVFGEKSPPHDLPPPKYHGEDGSQYNFQKRNEGSHSPLQYRFIFFCSWPSFKEPPDYTHVSAWLSDTVSPVKTYICQLLDRSE